MTTLARIPTTTEAEPGLFVMVSIPIPALIADHLPDSRPGVPPHLSLVGGSPITEDGARRLHDALARGDYPAPVPRRIVLDGTGDYRDDPVPMPIVYLRVAENPELAAFVAALDEAHELTRRFPFGRGHVTLASRNLNDPTSFPDAELDAVAAKFANFHAEFPVTELTLTLGTGTVAPPWHRTWSEVCVFPTT